MHLDQPRTARAGIAYPSRCVAWALEDVVPRVAERTETVALFLVICAFWGLVLYLALTSTLN